MVYTLEVILFPSKISQIILNFYKPDFGLPKISLNDFDFSISVSSISESTIFAEFLLIPLW